MSKMLQEILSNEKKDFKIFARDASKRELQNFKGALGVIDFSSMEATPSIVKLCVEAGCPLVCGTTGWKSKAEAIKIFEVASQQIPILFDSNFSLGIEVFCQMAEKAALISDTAFKITDIHHIHKKDSPSGTALKIEARIRNIQPGAKIRIESIREGEVAGEHRLSFQLEHENLELVHRAESRQAFAIGAIKALDWLVNQKPGIYNMQDLFK